MQVIVPAAGYGTRLRPQTFSKPKPLINVAGKPVPGHILDILDSVDIDEMIFIIGHLGDQIEGYVRANYAFETRFIEQEELLGQAHALHLAHDIVHGPVLILFVDTLVEMEPSGFRETDGDGLILVKRVPDPRRFGVVAVEDGTIRQLIEKPDSMNNDLAIVGVYYLREGEWLMSTIDELLKRGQKTKGEYYLADALQIMIDQGARLRPREVSVWQDCGKPDTVLETNRYLLGRHGGNSGDVEAHDALIVPPVYVAPSARITRSVIGPYVTIGDGCTVSDTIIRDSIVDEGAQVEGALVERSLISREAVVRGTYQRLNVGDSAALLMDAGSA